jgi:hypothetical protein
MHYDRTVIAYHGCDAEVAAAVLAGERTLQPSENDYDWLGKGIYFWEYGADRAFRFAQEQAARGRVKTPAVLGALVQLGNCFDLMDTRFTGDLTLGFSTWAESMRKDDKPLPTNSGKTPEHELRRLDCAVLNWYLDMAAKEGNKYDTVRCGFPEGEPAFEGSGIYQESHIQIAVRNPACVLGVFRPTMRLS